MIESEQEIKGQVSIEQRYFIAAGVKTVERCADDARAHWDVEAMHWVFDVTFRDKTTGHVIEGKVAHFQVTLKIGFRIEGD